MFNKFSKILSKTVQVALGTGVSLIGMRIILSAATHIKNHIVGYDELEDDSDSSEELKGNSRLILTIIRDGKDPMTVDSELTDQLNTKSESNEENK